VLLLLALEGMVNGGVASPWPVHVAAVSDGEDADDSLVLEQLILMR
jgi:hypothetical protein